MEVAERHGDRRARRQAQVAPKGVKKWQSDPASSGYTYKRTFKKVGTYKIICTLHEEMKMTVKVKD